MWLELHFLLLTDWHKYYKTQFNWDKVKQHLLNHGNISVDIQDLQQDILKLLINTDVITGSDYPW